MGGKAISNTSPIPHEIAEEVFEDISKLPFLSSYEIYPIGSTLKKDEDEFYGDLDLCLYREDETNLDDLIKELEKLHYITEVKKISKNLISFGFSHSGETYQIDLVISNNPIFTRWMYYSPNITKNESKWKGLYRNSLLSAMCHFKDVSVNPKEKTYTRYLLSFDSGLHRVTYRFTMKNSNVLLKVPIEVSREFITDNPDKICYLLLGMASAEHVLTYENIIELVKEFKELKWPMFAELIDHHLEDLKKKSSELEIPSKNLFWDYL